MKYGIGLILFSFILSGPLWAMDFSKFRDPVGEICEGYLSHINHIISKSELNEEGQKKVLKMSNLMLYLRSKAFGEKSILARLYDQTVYGELSYAFIHTDIEEGAWLHSLLLKSGKNGAIQFSKDLDKYLVHLPFELHSDIKLFNNFVLKAHHHEVEYINVFRTSEFEQFVAELKKIPTDQMGKAIQSSQYNRASDLVKRYSISLYDFYMDGLSNIIEKGKAYNRLLENKSITEDAHYEIITNLKILASEFDKDFQAGLMAIYENFPQISLSTSSRWKGATHFFDRFAEGIKNRKAILENVLFQSVTKKPNPIYPGAPEAPVSIEEFRKIIGASDDAIILASNVASSLFRLTSDTKVIEIILTKKELRDALVASVKGDSILAKKLMDEVIFTLEPSVIGDVADLIIKASKDMGAKRDISRATTAEEFKTTIESVMFNNFIQSSGDVFINIGEMKIPVLNISHAQIFMAREIMRVGNINAKSKIMEIGFGNPSIIKGLAEFAKAGKVVGVDLNEISEKVIQEMKPYDNISLYKGKVPNDSDLTETIKEHGPFNVIYALDVYKPKVRYGERFNPGIDYVEYLKWVKENLADDGKFIIMNDYETKMVFTPEQLDAAGLKIKETTGYIPTVDEKKIVPKIDGVKDGHMLIYTIIKK